MGQIDEQLTEQFYRWEMRGRGGLLFDMPVSPEPPFYPFPGHFLPQGNAVDEGQRQSIGSRFLSFFSSHAAESPAAEEEEEQAEPETFERSAVVEVKLSLPKRGHFSAADMQACMIALGACQSPISFEVLADHSRIAIQFACNPEDAATVARQVSAHFPGVECVEQHDTLLLAWQESEPHIAVTEFALEREFMLPLGLPKHDVFTGLIGVAADLHEGELALYQVIFQPVSHAWSESALRAVTDGEGGSFFVNRPDLVAHARKKISQPLYAASVRVVACSASEERAWNLVSEMASPFQAFSRPDGNELGLLGSEGYPPREREEDIILRQTRRTGMLLNAEELAGFVHLPSPEIQPAKLGTQSGRTKSAPKELTNSQGVFLGWNIHAGRETPVYLSHQERVRHMHIVGASGTGKSTLLFNLICNDIERGEGLAVLDPHGDLIERILSVIPNERIGDVVLLDPSDEEFSVGFNILSAHSDLEKTVLASDLISVFERLSTSWGDSMNAVLRNAILAFLESEQGGTLADLRRFLIDPAFRASFLESVSDPEVVYYWRKAFPQLTGNKSIGPVVTRLDTFLAPKPIRFMVSQRENKLDFSRIMDERKIFLAKLPQGEIGRENSYLLGSLLVAKFQQAAMSRQRLREEDRNFFSLYLDEFHHFITPSLAEMLSGARKYRVALVLAHQELRQLQRDAEVASATLSNPYTRVVFRVGDADARTLADGFASFAPEDLQSLGIGEAVCRVERSDHDFNITIPLPEEQDTATAADTRQRVIEASRSRYGAKRTDIETKLREALYTSPPTEKKETAPKTAAPARAEASPLDTASKSALPDQSPSEPEKTQNIPSKDADNKHLPKAGSEAKPETSLPGDLGRGGAQHQAIQQRIKAVAENLGYKATIEKSVLEGQGSIDLVLEKVGGGSGIACEINVTSTVDYEVGNVTKCLKAGFSRVAVICPRSERLARLEEAVNGCLAPIQSKQVGFYSPDAFISFLQNLALEEIQPSEEVAPAPEIRRGYKVKRSFVALSPEESKAREDAALKMITGKMRKKAKGAS
jgi:hypothetical protein